ncbi:MAG TPA: hypothetical protein VMU14_16090 [Acidimicrobiales bacterium]|nr:hypothetical protein [Acidimicrobiales bacterium]
MPDLDAQDDLDADDDPGDDDPGDDDPWPARCEGVAALLVAVVVCTLAEGIFLAAAASGSPSRASFATRLRLAGQVLGPFEGVVLVVAALLVALDGITSGERRGYATNAGRVSLIGAVVLATIIAVGGTARAIDVLTGHISPVGYFAGLVSERLSLAVIQCASVLAAIAAGWLALRALDDAAWAKAFHQSSTPDEAGTERPTYLEGPEE